MEDLVRPELSVTMPFEESSESHADQLKRALEDEVRRTDILIRIGEAIGSGRDAVGVVQTVVDGGVELTGAAWGAFFYNVVEPDGEMLRLYSLSGAPKEAFERFPMPRSTKLLGPTVQGEGIVRSDDVTRDARYGQNLPYRGMPEGHLPVRSYLAVPVKARSGQVMGGLFFGHPEPARFQPTHERLMTGLAGQAAAALEAVRAHEMALSDAEARRVTEASLGEDLSFALNAGRMGSWKLDVATRAYEASDLCKANYGRRQDEDFGFDDLLSAVHPGDRPRMRKAIETAIRDGSPYDIEYRVIHPSGEERWVHVRGRADLIREGGGAKRMAGVSLDITERRRSEARQKLLLNELNHRVKNTLAAVQSIAFQTLRTTTSPKHFREAFESRLLALSQTHNLLTRENWESAGLKDVLLAELEAFGGPARVHAKGPDLQLPPKAAVAFGMAFHELATNAAKYGALSSPSGLVKVTWGTEDDVLWLEWREEGGPPVEPPTRQGFGTRLLQSGLSAELGGRVELDYARPGLTCAMRLPLSALEREG